MIVRPAGASLLLITQPDHAALARRVMDHWRADDLVHHARSTSILHAIEEHDNGWRELDDAPDVLATTGQIADFITAPVAVRQAVWPRGARRLAADPWAAALVAQHAIYVYSRFRGDPEWTTFFDGMTRLRDGFAIASGVPPDGLMGDYVFLRVADLLSLTFCQQWTETREDFGYAVRWADDRVVITPDPFGGATVDAQIRARELPSRAFHDAADLAAAWRDGCDVVLSGAIAAEART